METILEFLQAHLPDVIILAIILIWAGAKAVQGLYKSLMAVVVLVLAICIGLGLSGMAMQPVGTFVWEKYGPTIEERFDEEFGSAISGGENALNGFKENWDKLLENSGISQINGLISTLSGEGGADNAGNSDQNSDNNALAQKTFSEKIKATVMENAQMICFKVVHVILFVVITLLALLVLGLLKDWISNITKLPVVGKLDHVLGFVLGFAEAVIVILFVVRLAALLGIDTFKELSKDNLILKWFCGGGFDKELISGWFGRI